MRMIALLAMAVAGIAFTPEPQADRTNVVFILIDDMGWTDLGCMGCSLYETPNIDRLAREGMKFTQAYSACTVCSPTRASLIVDCRAIYVAS